MITITDIRKGYGNKVLFRDLSWRIDSGDRIGMIGPNGVGKTTLARIVAGEEEHDGGEVNLTKGTLIGFLAQDVKTFPDQLLIDFVVGGRPELVQAHKELEKLERLVSACHDEATQLEYAHALDRFQQLGGYSAEAEAARILAGLGFRQEEVGRRLHTFSGGWIMRAALARLLFQKPHLLVLDEPTNHLDLPALTWLEGFLSTWGGAYLVISHDRTFLNTMVDKIAELEAGRLNEYPGGYDDYVELKEREIELLEAKRKNQEQRIAQVQRFIDRYRAQKNRARQAGSRKKMLELLEKEKVRLPPRPKKVHFTFPQPERSGTPVITLRGIKKSYADVVVYRGIDFVVTRGDKVALVGPNGAGKSTLLKIAAGVLPFDAGERRLGYNASAHYYAQHQLEALDPQKNPMQEMAAVPGWDNITWLRSLLGALLLGPKEIETRIADLSGGEKAKLALAKMLIKPANLLLLDEPTNHLDPQAREVLEDALAAYAGSMVFISHDRTFINRIANRVVEVVAGRLTDYLGNYDDYLRAKEKESQKPATAAATLPVAEGKDTAGYVPKTGFVTETSKERRKQTLEDQKERRRRQAHLRGEMRKATKEIRKRVEETEAKISVSEKKLEEIHRAFADPDTPPGRMADLGREEKAVREFLENLYKQWEAVSSELEAAESLFQEKTD
jgi:ATP-binding cassette subfamily F protein 3